MEEAKLLFSCVKTGGTVIKAAELLLCCKGAEATKTTSGDGNFQLFHSNILKIILKAVTNLTSVKRQNLGRENSYTCFNIFIVFPI